MSDRLSMTFAALADPTRRAILARLADGESSVTDLARPFRMTLPAITKHLKVLERAGLITRSRRAQVRPCTLRAKPLKDAADWVERYRQFWEERLDRLDEYLQELQEQEKKHGRKNDADFTFTTPSDREIVLTRRFAAPRRLVYEAFSKPEHLVRWWGSKSMIMISCEMDFAVGGAWRFVLRGPDGKDHGFRGKFLAIVPEDRITWTFEWEGMPGHIVEETVAFAESAGATTITVRCIHTSKADRDGRAQSGMLEGARQSYDRLAELLEGLLVDSSPDTFVMVRVFNAPRELVYQMWTDPTHMSKWWGPHIFTTPVCQLDPRPGGAWRIVMRGPDGSEHPAKGVYRDVRPPERLVMTIDHSELSDQWHDLVDPGRDKSKGRPAVAGLMTVTFDDLGGKTRLTIRTRFESAAIRNALVRLGMSHGWAQSLEKLEAVLANA
jgi:uncharacterized protein YndB with AHSA1/START domain/DNA-binding transcriptional ArsR family regulator